MGRTWEEYRNDLIFESANARAYRDGVADALNCVLDSVFKDMALVKEFEGQSNIDILWGEFRAANAILERYESACKVHCKELDKLLKLEVYDEIERLEIENSEDDAE